MSCCLQGGTSTQTNAALVFRRAELIYDIRTIAYTIGDVLPAEQQHQKHLVQDIASEANLPFAMRVLNLSHRECVEMLFPLTRGELPETLHAGDNRLAEPNNYIIFLHLPAKFSLSTFELLDPAVHDYMVYRVLYEWLALVFPEKAEAMAAHVATAKERILRILNHRNGRARLRLSPAW